jgi:hypothetical protein
MVVTNFAVPEIPLNAQDFTSGSLYGVPRNMRQTDMLILMRDAVSDLLLKRKEGKAIPVTGRGGP